MMGVLADRTRTRWGKFRPWILFTALPWGVVMVLAYTVPHGWSATALIRYAVITNMVLMTLYSVNNMPYAALGGVMTGDVDERARFNSYRFVAVKLAQLVVGGFTLPLVAKFAACTAKAIRLAQRLANDDGNVGDTMRRVLLDHVRDDARADRACGGAKSTPAQDFADLFANSPWAVMFAMTLIHFAILSLKGGAFYNYYHYYADKAAMYDWLQTLHLTGPPLVAALSRRAAS